jgi:hypothetical protein
MTLSSTLLEQLDRLNNNRSALLEQAAVLMNQTQTGMFSVTEQTSGLG